MYVPIACYVVFWCTFDAIVFLPLTVMVVNLVKLQELSLVPPLFDRLILMVSGFVSLILPKSVLVTFEI